MAIAPIDIEKMTTLGLLPENLPAAYTTKNIWAPYTIYSDTYTITKPSVGEHAIYNASKRGGQRRIFGVPHPAFVRETAVFFSKHWNDVSKVIDSSPGSLSKPIFHAKGARYVGITPHAELPKLRLKAFSRFKFCLLTDVSRFFSSTYKLCSVVEGNPFAGTYWPLTLELNHLGMADPAWLAMKSPPSLRALHDANASIIEWSAPPKVFGSEEADADGDMPDHAIEDLGSDYEGESEESDDDDEDDMADLNGEF